MQQNVIDLGFLALELERYIRKYFENQKSENQNDDPLIRYWELIAHLSNKSGDIERKYEARFKVCQYNEKMADQ